MQISQKTTKSLTIYYIPNAFTLTDSADLADKIFDKSFRNIELALKTTNKILL
jgi:hypothetical protein